MSDLAQISVAPRDRLTIVHIAGEIDSSNAATVRERVTEAVPNEVVGLVIDLSNVTYLDSAGVGLLFDIAGRLSRAGQHLRVVVPPSSLVLRVLELTAVSTVAPLDASLDEAVRGLEAVD